MTNWIKVGLLSTAMISITASADKVDLKDKSNAESYALGYQIAKVFRDHKVDINFDAYSQGFKAGISGKDPALSEADLQLTLQNFQKDMMQKQEQKQLQEAEKNQKAGQDYLTANKKKSGVMTLPDGLQYKVITKGSGTKPGTNDTVVVDYEGALIDGTVFDSSYKRGMPAKFALNAVIPGWQEILQKMTVGSTWMIYVPPELAYGSSGSPGTIPPNATLVFKIHLISIDGKK